MDVYLSILNSSGCPLNQTPILVPNRNEVIVRSVIDILYRVNPSPECLQEMLPFVCLNWLGLCGDEELILPTASQCEDIQYRICEGEWKLMAATGVLLPDCDDFDEENNVICPSNYNTLTKGTHIIS